MLNATESSEEKWRHHLGSLGINDDWAIGVDSNAVAAVEERMS